MGLLEGSTDGLEVGLLEGPLRGCAVGLEEGLAVPVEEGCRL